MIGSLFTISMKTEYAVSAGTKKQNKILPPALALTGAGV